MLFASGNMPIRTLVVIFSVFLTVFTVILPTLPVRADILGNTSTVKIPDIVRLAQRTCTPPKVLSRNAGRCVYPKPRCRRNERLINGRCRSVTVNIQRCAPPNKLVNGRCVRANANQRCRIPYILVKGRCRLSAASRCRPPRRLIKGYCKLP